MAKLRWGPRDKLNERQVAFIDEVMPEVELSGNLQDAAERVGYARNSARRLKVKPKVAAEIRRRQEEARVRSDVRQDEVIGELMTIGFGNARELAEWVEGRRHVDSSTVASLSLIQVISVQRRPDGGVSRRVRLHPKIDALDKLARHLSLYGPDGGERVREFDARLAVLQGLPEAVLSKLLEVVGQIVEAPRPEIVEGAYYLQGPDLARAEEGAGGGE